MSSTQQKNRIDLYAGGMVVISAEGMDEPEILAFEDVDTVLDGEGDIWAQADNDRFYLPTEPWLEDPEDADTTLQEILDEYGIVDVNVELPAPKAQAPVSTFKRGDIVTNTLSGREALVLESHYKEPVGRFYTVIEKGHVYPKGCSTIPGAATFPEAFLTGTGQHFEEDEVLLLTLYYSI